ncbi:MAG: hypothetical protein GY931_20850 [Maribacter sp.]|nr:hypothetical protein [Maribacter sp.]
MPLIPENFNNSRPVRTINDASFRGLSKFIKNIEKHFFSEITVKENSSNDEKLSLILELKCNMTLSEMILHYDKGSWGTFSQSKYSLSKEIKLLERENNIQIDVDEFSLALKDTAVIIDKIYNQSISDQLDKIFNELGKHFTQYTKGQIEVPYEIFVAVFEEDLLPNEITLSHAKKTQNYLSFWALYFESENDAVIYDVISSKIIYNEDLFMLNH